MLRVDFSICIPTRNRRIGLERLLDSILKQTYTDYEVVILDNSDDSETKELYESKFKQYKQITYHRNNKVLMMGENWNKCISLSNFSWVKMMHDDDFFSSARSLEIIALSISNSEHKAFTFSYTNVYEGGRMEKVGLSRFVFYLKNFFFFYVYKDNFIGNPCCLVYHRSCAIQYKNEMRWLVDIDFYMRMRIQGFIIRYIPKMVINIGISELQATKAYKHNLAIELTEHQFMAIEFGQIRYYQSYFVFDTHWRLIRNTNLKEVDLEKYVSNFEFREYLKWIIGKQSQFSNSLLQKKLISGILKSWCYIVWWIKKFDVRFGKCRFAKFRNR